MAGATALVMLASLCWGLSGGIGGILMADGWDAFVVSFYRKVERKPFDQASGSSFLARFMPSSVSPIFQ